MVIPGNAAVCPGTVMHHRTGPVDHRFSYPVSFVWIDPDRPHELVGHHPLWSARRPAPVWFRRRDYLDGTNRPLGAVVRERAAAALGPLPPGPIRMLTQPRTWGWLFNPITIYLLWPATADPDRSTPPAAAVLEVTNTPWRERHLYAARLDPLGRGVGARFTKLLHVSPFLDEDFVYALSIVEAAPQSPGPGDDGANQVRDQLPRLTVELDVLPRIQSHDRDEPSDDRPTSNDQQLSPTPGRAEAGGPPVPVLRTRLAVDRLVADRSNLTTALSRNPLSTHRVSLGIHRQALRLWRHGVPFVSHPNRRPGPADGAPAGQTSGSVAR